MKQPRKGTTTGTSTDTPTTRKQAARKPAARKQQDGAAPRGTDEEIRTRAYHLYLERGGEPGGELEDWLQAEREHRERNDGRAASDRPASPPGP